MTANTTTQLSLSRGQRLRHFLRGQDRWRLASLLLVALLLIGGSVREALRERGQVTPEQPIVILATPMLPSPPTTTPSPAVEVPALQVASASPPRLSRAVIAYSAPLADAAIGAIEPGRIYTLTGRLGGEWLQAEVAGSGTVWLRLVDLAGLVGVPDIATPAAAPVVMLAAPVGAEPMAQPTVAPPPTPVLQILTAPAPTPWDSEAAREAEREAERQAWESVDDTVEGAP
jgi:hypothetical protein